MSLDQDNYTSTKEFFEILNSENGDLMKSLLEALLNKLMRLERACPVMTLFL